MSRNPDLAGYESSRGGDALAGTSAVPSRDLRRCDAVGDNVVVRGRVLVRGRGTISIGDDVVLDGSAAPIELLAGPGARIEIGRGSQIGPGVSVEAISSVSVGAGAVIGAHAKILDNNYHGTTGDRGRQPEAKPTVVGPGARIGVRATLLPGASLGAESVLEDDSVLSGRAPDRVIVGGAPAKLVRKLGPDEGPVVTQESGPVAPFRLLDEAVLPVGGTMMGWLGAVEDADRLPMPESGRRALGKLQNLAARAHGRWALRDAVRTGPVYAHGAVDVRNQGRLEVGRGCAFAGGPLRARLEVGPDAELTLGGGAIVNYGVLIRAGLGIRIGSGLLMGSRTLVLDRHAGRSGPVTIGDDVWLAHGVTVLPGVTIGDNSAVSAGTVVDTDVPAGCLAVGSPLKFRPLGSMAK
jgi:maltose O-acetyltransferase